MKKKCTITIRISAEEKMRIEQKAEEFGGSVAEYARTILQNPNTDLTGSLAQALACALCEHSKIVNCVEDQAIRKRFANWEEGLWRSIR